MDDRKLDVLRAIVEDYVATREPVGSKALVERHRLDVSPATIRNDMAVLEDEGYLIQPHTSAGRIPTDKGYRLFVDRLTTIKPLSGAERRAISTFLAGAADVDDIVHRTVRLLAQLTQQVALVQYPAARSTTIRHVELVSLHVDRRRNLLALAHHPTIGPIGPIGIRVAFARGRLSGARQNLLGGRTVERAGELRRDEREVPE